MYKAYISLMFRRREFIFSFLFMTAISIGQFLFCCMKMKGLDIGQTLSADKLFIGRAYENDFYTVLQFILPLLIVLPFGDIAVQEGKNNTRPVVLTRMTPKQLVGSQALAAGIGGGAVVFAPFLMNFILGLIAFPLKSVNTSLYSVDVDLDVYMGKGLDKILFPGLFMANPYLYNFIIMLLLAAFCALCAALIYLISYFLRGKIILLFLAFLVNTLLIIITNKTEICIAPFEYLFSYTELYDKLPFFLPLIFAGTIGLIALLIPGCAKKLTVLR